MHLTDSDLDEIKKRNEHRKKLKGAASLGPWEYDSWAFVHQSERIPRNLRFGILVRPVTWLDALGKRIDEGLPNGPLVQQGYYDADYIAQSREDGAERDIDNLLAEIRFSRKNSK